MGWSEQLYNAGTTHNACAEGLWQNANTSHAMSKSGKTAVLEQIDHPLPELLTHKAPVTCQMSMENEESVPTDGQALLERVLTLEQSLNNQGPQQLGQPSSGTSATPSSTLNPSGDSSEYGLPQLATNNR